MRFIIVLITLLVSCHSRSEVTEWIPFELVGGHVRIEVVIDGIKSHAIIDSGSQLNVINTRFIKEHDLNYDPASWMTIRGAHAESRREVYHDVPIKLLGAEMALNLVETPFAGPSTGLLIGAPLLRNFIVQFDYPNGKLRFGTRDAVDIDAVANLPMRAQKGSGRPLIQVTLDKQKTAWMVLDTGNSGGIFMERGVAAREGWLEKYDVSRSLSRGANETAEIDNFVIGSVQFGPFELQQVHVAVPLGGVVADFGGRYEVEHSLIRGVEVEGLVGYDVLKHFILTLDYRSGQGHAYVPPAP